MDEVIEGKPSLMRMCDIKEGCAEVRDRDHDLGDLRKAHLEPVCLTRTSSEMYQRPKS